MAPLGLLGRADGPSGATTAGRPCSDKTRGRAGLHLVAGGGKVSSLRIAAETADCETCLAVSHATQQTLRSQKCRRSVALRIHLDRSGHGTPLPNQGGLLESTACSSVASHAAWRFRAMLYSTEFGPVLINLLLC